MGMFDSVIDNDGHEWQTKAFNRVLDRFRIHSRAPAPLLDCQVAIFGGADDGRDSLLTVRNGRIKAIDVPRDESLPLVSYSGVIDAGHLQRLLKDLRSGGEDGIAPDTPVEGDDEKVDPDDDDGSHYEFSASYLVRPPQSLDFYEVWEHTPMEKQPYYLLLVSSSLEVAEREANIGEGDVIVRREWTNTPQDNNREVLVVRGELRHSPHFLPIGGNTYRVV